MKKKAYDIVIIGSGSAGFSAAERAAALGVSVCVVEQAKLGGECPNWACVPTKSLLRAAHLYRQTRQDIAPFGIHADGVQFHFREVMAQKDAAVALITGAGRKISKIAKQIGVDVEKGHATFIDPYTVAIDGVEVQAKAVIIAAGTVPFIPPIHGIETVPYLLFNDAVSLTALPVSMAIVGGGPVGCEFATFFATFGVKVSLFQINAQILNREDTEIAGLARERLEELGVHIYTNTKVLSATKGKKKTTLTYQVGHEPRKMISVETLLLAAGKRANTEGLGLEAAKVLLDDRGRLQVTDTLQTSQKHIFAVGDISGSMQFTHTAHYEGVIAAENAVRSIKKQSKRLKRDVRVVPRATFVDPEVASVGMTADVATAVGHKVAIGRFPVAALGRSVTDGRQFGLMKLVVDKQTRGVLGGHYIGPRAGEVIHEVALAMQANLAVDVLAGMIHAYPTYSEIVSAAASMVE